MSFLTATTASKADCVRVYLDGSALLKRVISEAESAALVDALDTWASSDDVLASSSLTWIEVTRALQARLEGTEMDATLSDDALSGIAEQPMSSEVVSLARRIRPSVLRTLDAIHLASALLLDADMVVAYDKRLIDACHANSLNVATPGSDAEDA